jgi:nitrite reductase (NO-forming)
VRTGNQYTGWMPLQEFDNVFGHAGPNATASTHMIGEIFTHVYQLGSLTSPPHGCSDVGVPSGGAAILEFAAKTAGNFALMDHAIRGWRRAIWQSLM